MKMDMTNISPATPESVWAALRELAERQAETDRILTEKFAETDRVLTEKFAETDRQIEKVNKTLGSWATNHGFYAEEYFFNSFEKGKQNFFGEKFDEIEKSVKGIKKGFKDEYDLLMTNGHSVGIVEVKFKAHENDIPKVLKKVNTFRANFPEFKNHRVYLGLATMVFYPKLEEGCIKEGIAVIKQVGDNVVINDKHLKVF